MTVVVDHKTSKQPLDIYPIPEIVTLQYHTLYVPVNAFKNKQYRPQLIFTIRFTKGRSITLHATNARNVVNWMHGLSVLMNHATGYPIITKGKLWWSYLWSSSLFNATRTNTSAWKYLKKEIEEEMK